MELDRIRDDNKNLEISLSSVQTKVDKMSKPENILIHNWPKISKNYLTCSRKGHKNTKKDLQNTKQQLQASRCGIFLCDISQI